MQLKGICLCVAVNLLNIWDIISTNWLLAHGGGTLSEGNPVIAWAMSVLGWWWWIPKVISVILISSFFASRKALMAEIGLWFMAVIYMVVGTRHAWFMVVKPWL